MKKLLFAFLSTVSLSLFCPNKKWRNQGAFKNKVENLVRLCVEHEQRLIDKNKSLEEAINLVCRSHTGIEFSRLQQENKQFSGIIKGVISKYIK